MLQEYLFINHFMKVFMRKNKVINILTVVNAHFGSPIAGRSPTI